MQVGNTMASQEYVEEQGGGYYLAGSRVSLASVIYAFREGASPETIRQNFPSLSFGPGLWRHLQRLAARWKELEQHGQPPSGELQKRVEQARQRLLTLYR
jgi:hypothetical protein